MNGVKQSVLGDADVALCVDLDGTLIRSDLLWESLARLVKVRPLAALLVPFWLLRGRANLKRRLAERVALDPATLPYCEPLLEYLRAEKKRGRRCLLVTASDRTLAGAVADHLGFFDEVFGSDGRVNLRAGHKAAMLVARFGERGFDYAGDSAADLSVWSHARAAVLVGARASVARRARARVAVTAEFPRAHTTARSLGKLLRPYQWVKNFLVFVPLVTSHQIAQWAMVWSGLRAFASLCLCASAVYIVNDLLDIDADRRHPTKCRRPLAAGALPLPGAFLLGMLLLAAGFGIAAMVSPPFVAVLGVYVMLALAYSWRLKQTPLVDVFVLAGLYTLRVIAGHTATGIEYSDWLFAFSLFIFLSLALVKRFQELLLAAQQSVMGSVRARGYGVGDIPLLTSLGTASGYLAALVFALYVNSDKVRILYHRPTLLLLICPLLLYWISRVWMIAHRGGMHDDPVVFALKDPSSYLVGVLSLAVIWFAT